MDLPVFLRFGVLVGLMAVPRLRFPVITVNAPLEGVDLPSREKLQISTFRTSCCHGVSRYGLRNEDAPGILTEERVPWSRGVLAVCRLGASVSGATSNSPKFGLRRR